MSKASQGLSEMPSACPVETYTLACCTNLSLFRVLCFGAKPLTEFSKHTPHQYLLQRSVESLTRFVDDGNLEEPTSVAK